MLIIRPKTLHIAFTILLGLLLSFTGIAQTSVTMTVQNVIQTAPNIFEYDVMLTNTGTTSLALRGYSCGINHTAGMNGSGVISHTFVSRDASLASLPSITPGYTASTNHIRITTLNAAAGNEVTMTAGIPVRIATMRITNTVNFPSNFTPNLSLQLLTATGKTTCIATCIVTPPGTNYAINGIGNTASGGTLQVLSGIVNTPCLFLNPTSSFVAATTSTVPVTCYGQNTGSTTITLSGTGSAAPGGTSGTYKINGGSNISYNGNPFTISNLTAGSYTITVNTSFGCTDTAVANITQPSSGIASTFNAFICNGSYTLPWGLQVSTTGIYTHTYVASNGCDSIVTANITSGTTVSNAPTTVTACNSYNWSVNNVTYTTSGTYIASFTNAAGCDSNFTLNLTVNYNSVSSSSITTCNSYVWPLNGLTYTTSGTYTATNLNAQGCTNTQTLFLIIKNSSSSTTNVSVFSSYTWSANGLTYTSSGVYTYSTTNAAGCDSLLTLNLTILQVAVTMTMQNVVQTAPNIFEYDVMLTYTGNTSLALRGYSCGINHAAGMNASGTLTHTYISRDASLSALPIPTFGYTASSNHMRLTTTNASAGNEVTLTPGVPVRIATMRMTNSVNFPADFNPAFTMQTISASGKTQCVGTCIVTPPGSNYAINGTGNIPSANTLQSLTGVVNTPCFYLNPSASFASSVTSSTQVLCVGLSNGSAQIALSGTGSAAPFGTSGTYKINGGNSILYSTNPFTVSSLSAGIYTISATTSYGCTANTVVTISPASSISTTSSVSACNSYNWGGTSYTISGVYTHTFTSIAGCDSVNTLTLTINHSNTGSSSTNACESFIWNGITYTNSGTPTYTYTNVSGCDSVHTLSLTINHNNTGSSNVTACNSYLWNGVTYTINADPTHTYTNTVGCDSIHTLHLTIKYANTGSSTVTACDSYLWNGVTYTISAMPTHTYSNIAGCDSVHTLNLTINHSNTGWSNITACDTYSWNGITYTTNATPSHTYTNVAGCDSIHTLHITIHNSNLGSSIVSACESYNWNGNTYTISSTPQHVYTNIAGCDSTHTLFLTIHHATLSSTNVTSVNTYTWPANNSTYTTSGVYTATFVNAVGCDSIVSLHLSILTILVQADQEVSCHGNNDGSISTSGSGGSGIFTYDIDGANLFTNVTGFFQWLTPGIHTVCAKEASSNLIVCGTISISEPDILAALFTIDSLVSCTGGGGQISLSINGGTANSQPYLTLWTNANGDTLNDQTNDPYELIISNLSAGNYHVRIEDDHGCVLNRDTTLLAAICGDTLHLKLFIEGYYSGASTMTPVLLNQGESFNTLLTDTMTVELHDAVSPFALIDSKTAILNTDGTSTVIFSTIATPCYIVIKHRNGVQTWSANPIQFSSPSLTYDFSSDATQAYGDNQVEMEPGIWAIYTGDLNGDENVDLLDNSPLENDINAFQYGYFATDLNGDGNVDLLDLPLLEININNFVFSIHP